MKILSGIKEFIIGKPLNALSPKIKEHIALIAIIAWIGLGADGLSSSAYGPEEAFLALGSHHDIGIFLALATAITVFLISLSYNQVIELFPHGGGGYKVATHLLGPGAGVISGSALIVDYILTIAVSTASGVDAIFSLIPIQYTTHGLETKVAIITILMVLNLRGMKESIHVLIPLFLGFMLTHLFIIGAGMFHHGTVVFNSVANGTKELNIMSGSIGMFASIALLLRAYSLGGGTYTGLEAVSNNVSMLAEPRVRTGKLTMLYMAISLSLTAGGIILLYIIWHATPEPGKTLNAVVFNKIIHTMGIGGFWLLPLILFFEAGLLFAGANTGFLGCPAVMANMAVDKWLPRQFRELSSRLVTQNGILISGIAAIVILIWARGRVSTLVILYSINVFLTFSMSLLGLSVYWFKSRKNKGNWKRRLSISLFGFIVCSSILIITTLEKFTEGAWLTLVITTCVVTFCFFVRNHYRNVGKKLVEADRVFANHFDEIELKNQPTLPISDKNAKTAVFFVTKHYGAGLHALLWVKRLFPDVFKNYIFLTSGEIDSATLSNDEIFGNQYRKDLNTIVERYKLFCTEHGMESEGLFSYGVDEISELIKLTEYVQQDYPDCVFFASKLVFVDETWWSRLLHNNTVTVLQRQLHLQGKQMVILPMKI
ncbi:MAG: amino acid transporter [Burkholderiales bacterium]|jgi:amino acid transporter|nr:amino acid transporter [Burkholderiales bacterium]